MSRGWRSALGPSGTRGTLCSLQETGGPWCVSGGPGESDTRNAMLVGLLESQRPILIFRQG